MSTRPTTSAPTPAVSPTSAPGAGTVPVSRARAKLRRRKELLSAAAGIIAEKGFHAMTLEGLGEAAEVSGPAV